MAEMDIKRRFCLFSGDYYYPTGGMDDYQSAYATLEEAIAAVRVDRDWATVAEITPGGLEVRWRK